MRSLDERRVERDNVHQIAEAELLLRERQADLELRQRIAGSMNSSTGS